MQFAHFRVGLTKIRGVGGVFDGGRVVDARGYFRLKLSPTSGYCPQWLIFFKKNLCLNNCKEAMNI